jgi:hypothetical protein
MRAEFRRVAGLRLRLPVGDFVAGQKMLLSSFPSWTIVPMVFGLPATLSWLSLVEIEYIALRILKPLAVRVLVARVRCPACRKAVRICGKRRPTPWIERVDWIC